MLRPLHRVIGSTAPFVVSFLDDSGSTEDISDATDFSAKAKHRVSGTVVNLTAAISAGSSTDVEVTIGAGDFTENGQYNLRVYFTDVAGNDHIVPTDGDSFRIIMEEAF